MFSYDAHSTFLIWGMPLQGFILPGLLFFCTPSGLSLARNSNLNDCGHKRLIFGPPGRGERRLQPCWKEQHWVWALWGTSVFQKAEAINVGVWDGPYTHTHKIQQTKQTPPQRGKINFPIFSLVSALISISSPPHQAEKANRECSFPP